MFYSIPIHTHTHTGRQAGRPRRFPADPGDLPVLLKQMETTLPILAPFGLRWSSARVWYTLFSNLYPFTVSLSLSLFLALVLLSLAGILIRPDQTSEVRKCLILCRLITTAASTLPEDCVLGNWSYELLGFSGSIFGSPSPGLILSPLLPTVTSFPIDTTRSKACQKPSLALSLSLSLFLCLILIRWCNVLCVFVFHSPLCLCCLLFFSYPPPPLVWAIFMLFYINYV